jgi:hypothetical protein
MSSRVIVLAGVMWLVSSCESPCDVVVNSPGTVCLRSGATQPGGEFVLETDALSSTPTCEVHVNGAQLDLVITGNRCTNRGIGEAEPVAPSPARCTVTGLAAGTYTVRGTSTTFTVPGADVPACEAPPAQAASF